MAARKLMTRYVAFLRGINVGGHRVKMDTLRELFEKLKLANVSTFIASGNVIFDTTASDPAEIEKRIEDHLARALGYGVDAFLRTRAELATVVAFRPFESDDRDVAGHTLHVGFLRGALSDDARDKMLSFRTELDDFRIHGRELYWLCRGKTTDSLVTWPVVAKTVPMPSTMRNMTTIRRLSALHPPQ